MNISELNIVPYRPEFREQVIDLAVSAWEPVFARTINEVPRFAYDNFWSRGWQFRQESVVASLLDSEAENIWLAFQEKVLAGFVGIFIHPEDRMGEISIVAVSPDHQRQGVGKALMHFAEQQVRDRGMKMVMAETVWDSGHEPARRTYEALGYEQWPVARYFKKL